MKVPFLDLKAQYDTIKDEINEAIQNVFDSCAFAGGPFVEEFEKNFAKFCKVKHCVGVGSGTEALWMALIALGVGSGDEVITVPNTFIATAEAISFCGATPAFVDIDDKTYNMDSIKLNEFLEDQCFLNESTNQLINHSTKRPVRAVIPVHLFGQMADMDSITETAQRHNLYVIEDASQAHGAEFKGKPVGSIGDAACFSFYPGKNLGAYGEAGAVITNNPDIAEKIKTLRDHGQQKKYHHQMIGWNARMDGIQGAVLNVKLKHITSWNLERRKIADLYTKQLGLIKDLNVPFESHHAKHVYHIYAIRLHERDRLMSALSDHEIYCGIHYPRPVHLQPAYKSLDLRKGSFPIAEKCAAEYLSLPMYPELKEDQVSFVVDKIKNFLTGS
jgi:dTDP-4-amino-4,6-dideoxygalactose transaminase